MLRIRAHAVRIAVAVLVLATTVTAAAPAAADLGDPPPYVPPVDAPVADPFRPPDHPYGPGNRGLTYELAPGTPVHASADGTVTFAGPVAGALHVTVLHPDGVRTSYSFLTTVEVRIGQRVGQGDVVGTAGAGFHLGARLGDAYFDPASLFGEGPMRVRLVPFDDPIPGGLSGERGALGQLIGGLGGLIGKGVTWVDDRLELAAHYWWDLHPLRVGPRILRSGWEAWQVSRRECTEAGEPIPPPGAPRAAILVGGLGSSSDDAAIDDVDTTAAGYDPGDVIRFSYAGGRIPDPADELDVGAARPYDASHTLQDLHESGALLADLVEDAVDAADGRPVDLLAHSQGGLVTRLALAELERRHGEPWLDERLGVVVTLGTPHEGADLATGLELIRTTRLGDRVTDAASRLPIGLTADAPAVQQLSETSDVIAELAATPLPDGVPVTTIGARADLIVPVPRTRLDGATQVTVPVGGLTAHDSLPGSDAATREVSLAVAGMPPGCIGFVGAVTDRLAGEAIAGIEDHLAAGAWWWAMRRD